MMRSILAALLVVVGLVALGGSAHAAPSPSPSPSEARVAGGLFTPSRADDGIVWRALWVVTPESASEISAGSPQIIRFASPLTSGESLEPGSKVTPVIEEGAVVGVMVAPDALDGRSVTAVVKQRVSLDGTVRYGAPVAVGTALQIIDGDLGAGTRFEVETNRFLERGVGHVGPPGTSHAAREEARRLTGYTARVTGAAVYVRGDDVTAAGGVRATVVTARSRGHLGSIAVAVLFAVAVVGLVAAVRRLRHAASVERADALLASELDALDPRRGGAR